MSEPYKSVREKVSAIFSEFSPERARHLEGPISARSINDLLGEVLLKDHPAKIADEIAFHLVDWNSDAAFLVAVHLFPERFTREEIHAGIDLFLVHVPAHLIAAARLSGNSTEDIFLEGPDKP